MCKTRRLSVDGGVQDKPSRHWHNVGPSRHHTVSREEGLHMGEKFLKMQRYECSKIFGV